MSVRGDGSADDTIVVLLDPAVDSPRPMTFGGFMTAFEGGDAVTFGTGIFHW